jgi:predicted dehydrogenase
MKRYAIVGTGGRAKMFIDASTRDFSEHATLVGMCDLSQTRMDAYNRLLTQEYGLPAVPTYTDFDQMIAETKPDTVIVTTMDSTHHLYINRSMELGCDVLSEKPMTIDLEKAQAIFETIKRTGKNLRVTFNYRYMPIMTDIKRLIMEGAIGQPLKVDFMWVLDVRHGADYFRRWHREKDKSGGLLVHKATHHFDLVNWWVESYPQEVFAMGELKFYGRENAAARGEQYPYHRYTGVDEAKDDPFALRLDEDPSLKALYLDAETDSGYLRDRNVFGDNITTEDTMAVIARYQNGVQLSYSLVAYSPWEGYRLAITGTKGRLEADDVEAGVLFVAGKEETTQPNSQRYVKQLRVYPMWDAPYHVPVLETGGGHGGGDEVMLRDIFLPTLSPDPYHRAASHIDGAASILMGVAANLSIERGERVKVDELMQLTEN